MAENAMTKLKKSDYLLFLDVSGGSGSPSWKRSVYSTVFALNPNPQTETTDYIGYENPVTDTTNYQPELPHECVTQEGEPIYDFMIQKFFDLPVGSGLVVPVLLCFGGSDKKAWQCATATITLGELNTVDAKLNFTINFSGDISRGTYTIVDGAPTFSAAS